MDSFTEQAYEKCFNCIFFSLFDTSNFKYELKYKWHWEYLTTFRWGGTSIFSSMMSLILLIHVTFISFIICLIVERGTAWKVSVFRVILVRIFPHLSCIRTRIIVLNVLNVPLSAYVFCFQNMMQSSCCLELYYHNESWWIQIPWSTVPNIFWMPLFGNGASIINMFFYRHIKIPDQAQICFKQTAYIDGLLKICLQYAYLKE